MIDIEELEKLAKAATPGPWEVCAFGSKNQRGLVGKMKENERICDVGDAAQDLPQRDMNTSFIAAANPQAILELIERIRMLEQDAYGRD